MYQPAQTAAAAAELLWKTRVSAGLFPAICWTQKHREQLMGTQSCLCPPLAPVQGCGCHHQCFCVDPSWILPQPMSQEHSRGLSTAVEEALPWAQHEDRCAPAAWRSPQKSRDLPFTSPVPVRSVWWSSAKPGGSLCTSCWFLDVPLSALNYPGYFYTVSPPPPNCPNLFSWWFSAEDEFQELSILGNFKT